jgi:DNA topoisomerase-3
LLYQTERNMVAVCQGTKSKNDMIVEAVDQYKDMFIRARDNFDKVITVMINVNCVER